MKTIEQIACERHTSDLEKPEHKRIGDTCFIDWANLGAREAQKLIPVREELPSVENGFLNKEVLAFIETRNGKGYYHLAIYTKGGEIVFEPDNDDDITDENGECFLEKGWYKECEQIESSYDSIFIRINPTHWRPIERK